MTGIILAFYCLGIGVTHAVGDHFDIPITFQEGPAPVFWPLVLPVVVGWKLTKYILEESMED